MTGCPNSDPPVPGSRNIVGVCPQVEVLFEGKPVRCLLDTGSQVTLMSESHYQWLFQERGVGQKGDLSWLTLRAANGLEIPYVGYTIIDVQVGEVRIPKIGVVITKDATGKTDLPILGMNVISTCWDVLFSSPQEKTTFLSVQPNDDSRELWKAAFQDCQRVRAMPATPAVRGSLRPAYRRPVWVPAQSELTLWARVPSGVKGGQCVLIEPLDVPDVVCAARTIGVVRQSRIPVRVRNLNPFPVSLNRYQRIANISCEPWKVWESEDIVLTEVSPGVVEVGVQQVSFTANESVDMLDALTLQGEGLSREQEGRLSDLLQKWKGVFAAHEEDYGRTDVVRHQIHTSDAVPIRERYRPIPPTLYPEIRSLLEGMLSKGIIRESTSPWAAPIVLVRKKDGAWRFCVDYRKLNAVTHKDAYPLPRIEEALTNLSKATCYSTLDLASGYWQVEVDPQHREKTAFTTPMGLFEFERMPFGLCNAPATFQRLMQNCLGGLISDKLLVYLDDVIIFSTDFESHIQDLDTVFARLANYGLKLRPEKCQLFRKQVKFLGHVVSAEGVAPDPEKVASVKDWVVPRTVRQVRSFLGFAGYYRRFIKGFADIARPLNALLAGTKKSDGRQTRPVNWTAACEQAFQVLKGKLIQSPVLAFADFALPFRLYTDASKGGLGAVLAQVQDGQERVVAYASRSLHPAEQNDANYSSFKLELLALKWSVTEKFKDYLWGSKFVVYTDNNPVVHLQSAKLGATEQRWAAQLANYDFEVKYRPGRDNVNADVLSRLPIQDVISLSGGGTSAPVEAVCNDAQLGWDPGSWKELQEQDAALVRVRWYVAQGRAPTAEERKREPVAAVRILSQWERLQVRDGVLVRHLQDSGTHEVYFQILVPQQSRRSTWEAYHVRSGHLGVDKTLSVLRRGFYWPGMEKEALQWVAECERCALRKARLESKAPLVPIVVGAPLEVIALDFLSLGRPNDEYQYILTATDLFTRYAWAIPTKDQTARTTARVLWQYILQPFGCPERFHSDQGPNFESMLIAELCKYYGCRKSRTTSYHPQGNGVCERFNQTLLSLLGTLEEDQQTQWVRHLPALVQAYNNTAHASTGFTPFYLMFGRNARLPVEVTLGVWNGREEVSTEEWVQQHHERLVMAYEKAGEQAGRAADRSKVRYDRNAKALPLLPGERVLIRTDRRRKRGKLADRWEAQPYVVIGQVRPDAPTYQVRPEGKEGPSRTLHRNRLRVCTFQPQVDPPREVVEAVVPQLTDPMLMLLCSGNGPVVQAAPHIEEEVNEVPELRRSQRENRGRPPVRYNN